MKRSVLVVLALMLLCVPQMFAAIVTELVLSDGTNTATIDVETGNVVTCTGACGGFTTVSGTDHGTVIVIGTLGQFDINITGKGDAATIDPTLMNLNQIDVSSTGAGTLSVLFTDTGVTKPADSFLLGVSGVLDTQISTSQLDFSALMSGSDFGAQVPPGVAPAGTLIGQFLNQTGLVLAASGTFANPLPGTVPYTLQSQTVFDFTGAGSIQANFTISNNTVPEPASIVLFGTLLLVTTIGLRRNLRRT